MGLFTRQQKTAIITTEWRFPVLSEVVELPPYKRGEHVWHVCPSGLRIPATVAQVTWEDTIYNQDTQEWGAWSVQVGYYPVVQGKQDESEIRYTWTGVRSLEVA